MAHTPILLELFPLPYTSDLPPEGLYHPVQTVAGRSDTVAFHTGLDGRDVFLGRHRCVVCGEEDRELLEHCHIIGRTDIAAWDLLKTLGWAPNVKGTPEHESRNGVTMCCNHHRQFNGHSYFIRFHPKIRKYILVVHDSYNKSRSLLPFHGRAIALNINHPRAPLPLLFMVHEYMVRGRNFFRPAPNLVAMNRWQIWMDEDGIVNDDGTFNHDPPPPGPPPGPPGPHLQELPPIAGPSGSQTFIAPPTADVIENLMKYQHNMPSWKAWQKESMGWEGTGEENMKKYIEEIGVETDE